MRELDDLAHHGREPRDRSGAQVVAIREPAGDHNHVHAVQVALGVPEEDRVANALGGLESVYVVAGAGEADDAELHSAPPASSLPESRCVARSIAAFPGPPAFAASPSSISQSSINGFASRRLHISGNRSGSSSSSSISRPTWTLRTPAKPSALSARSTVCPW